MNLSIELTKVKKIVHLLVDTEIKNLNVVTITVNKDIFTGVAQLMKVQIKLMKLILSIR